MVARIVVLFLIASSLIACGDEQPTFTCGSSSCSSDREYCFHDGYGGQATSSCVPLPAGCDTCSCLVDRLADTDCLGLWTSCTDTNGGLEVRC